MPDNKFPSTVLLGFESPLLVSNRSLLSRCQEKGSCKEGPGLTAFCTPPHTPTLAGWAYWALPVRTASEPRDTNPGEPRPLSPGNSCSASALGGTWKALVLPEAASGCHQHIYSKKGWVLPGQGDGRRLQLSKKSNALGFLSGHKPSLEGSEARAAYEHHRGSESCRDCSPLLEIPGLSLCCLFLLGRNAGNCAKVKLN